MQQTNIKQGYVIMQFVFNYTNHLYYSLDVDKYFKGLDCTFCKSVTNDPTI